MSTVLDARLVTARKQHTCGECGRGIDAGERHHCVKFAADGAIWTGRTCLQCHELRADLYAAEYRDEDENGQECYPYLPDVDWHEVRLWSPLWAARADGFLSRWLAKSYPTEAKP